MKSRTLRAILTGGAVGTMAVMSAASAMADPKGDRMEGWGYHSMGPSFADLDSDGDGQLSEEEFSSLGAVWLAEIDTDGDGLLSQEELAAAIIERMTEFANRGSARMIERLDDNDDGMIGVDEIGHRHDPAEAFSRLDDDGDGSISEDEFEHMKARDGRRHRGGKWGNGHRDRDRK